MSALDLFRVVGSAVAGSANRIHAQLRGLGPESDNRSAEPVDNAFVMQPLGLFAHAVVAQSLRVLGWRRGDEVIGLGWWNKSIAQSPAVDSGETRVYSVGEPAVCLRVGPVNIELRVNVTGEVRLAADAATYAGKEVARKDDRVRTKLYAKMSGEVLPGDRRVIAMFAQASDGSWVQVDYGTSDPGALSGTYGYGAIYEGAAKVKA